MEGMIWKSAFLTTLLKQRCRITTGTTKIIVNFIVTYQGLLGNNNGDANDDFMTPEGDVEPNTHAFGEKWRVIDHVTVTSLQNEEPYSETKPFVDLCVVDRERKAESERLCHNLKTGIFKSECYKYC
jgi:hypothetical protein